MKDTIFMILFIGWSQSYFIFVPLYLYDKCGRKPLPDWGHVILIVSCIVGMVGIFGSLYMLMVGGVNV